MNKIRIAALGLGILAAACQNTQTAQNGSGSRSETNTTAAPAATPSPAARHLQVRSANNFTDTYARLKKSIEEKEPLTIIAELDHAENARKAGLELRPTKIIMFGNPRLGTPLMKADQEIGLDLPQKMLVYEDEKGDVYLAYTDPQAVAESHGITGQDETIAAISTALRGLAENAAKK